MLTHGREAPRDPGRVVILGAGGFIGRALARSLATSGTPVLAVTRREVDLAADGAGRALAGRLRHADAVVVLAALTPDRGRGRRELLANLRIGATVCEALEAVTPDHVVYLSSDAVYPMGPALVSERSCAQPADLYGAMHLTRETMIATATAAPVAVLRPTLVFGAGDSHDSYGPNRFRRTAAEHGHIDLFGGGEERRDHLEVHDLVALVTLVLRHRSEGTVNLATGRSISYADLAGKVAAVFDPPVDIRHRPRTSPVTHRHFDVTAVHKAFPGFRFTDLDLGLAQAHREMARA